MLWFVTLLHTDIPTRAQIDRLFRSRGVGRVSLYLATDPATTNDAARIELKDLTSDAVHQLRPAGTDKRLVSAVEEQLADLADDEEFWRYQARSLALFATADSLTTFRLPNHLAPGVEVSDRFHVKPLLRSVTFPQTAFVLALAQGSVRLLEIVPGLDPATVAVPDLPTDVASAVGKASIKNRAPVRRLQGSEGQKVRMRQFARQIDHALRPVLPGHGVPLILAGAEPLLSIFRALCGYPDLAPYAITGNPETLRDDELDTAARDVLDKVYATQLDDVHTLFDQRTAQGRTATDIADVARLATHGAVDTVFVDIDHTVPGIVDDDTGAVEFADIDDAVAYGVVDEICRRVWLTDGRVLAVRRDDIPGRGDVAAILRYNPAPNGH